MKSGVSLFTAFIKDMKNLNPVFNKAEVETFIKKYQALFSNENIVKTLVAIGKDKQLFGPQGEPSVERMAFHKIVINILKFLVKEKTYEGKEGQQAIVYYFHQLSAMHIKNTLNFLLLLEPPHILEKGSYKKYIDEAVECHKDLAGLTGLYISLIKEPTHVFTFSDKEFQNGFKENLLWTVIEGINAKCIYAYLLHILGQKPQAAALFAEANEELKLIEKPLSYYCRNTNVNEKEAKKRIAAFKEASQFYKKEAEKSVEGNYLKVLQSLKKLNTQKSHSAETPFLCESVWAVKLAEMLEAIRDYRQNKIDKLDLEWIFKHLPNIQLCIENPKMGIACFANAKAICVELRSIYIEESKTVQTAEEKIYCDLIIFYLEALVKGYIAETTELHKLKVQMFAYDLIQDILDLPFELEGDGATYFALYEKYKAQYFGNDEASIETVDKIIEESQADIMVANYGHFHVRHFLVRVLPRHLVDQHSILYGNLWHHFSLYMATQFFIWRENLVLIGYNAAFVENVKLNMTRYNYYKAIYQPKRALQTMDAEQGYNEAVSFAMIESSHAGLLCAIGEEQGFQQQLTELNSHLSADMRAAAVQLEIMMQARVKPQIDTQEMLDEKLKEIEEIVNVQKSSEQGEFYQLLIKLEKKISTLKEEVESGTEINTVGNTKIMTTPLMLLEDILKQRDITAQSMELLFTACDFVNEKAFRYEQKVFYSQLCVLLIYMRTTLNQIKSNFVNKLIIEKLTSLLETSTDICSLVPEFDQYPANLMATTKVFVADVASLPWGQLDIEVNRLVKTYQLGLFANREYLFLTVSQIPLLLYPATTFETDTKVMHVLLKIISILSPEMGSMDLLVNELYLSLFRTICNHQITTCVKLHEKKIPKGCYQAEIASVDFSMRLLEQYMPQFKARHSCFHLKREQPGFETYWQNLKSLCDVYLMNAVVCVMKMDFNKAKKNIKIAQPYISHLQDNMTSEKHLEYVQQLERFIAELVQYWTQSENNTPATVQLGKAYQLFKKCEVQLPEIVKQLSNPKTGEGEKVVSLDKPDTCAPIPGFMLLLNAVLTLPRVKACYVKPQLAGCLEQFVQYQKILGESKLQVAERFCIVELMVEKLPSIISSLQAAFDQLPDIEVAPPMERLQALFAEVTVTKKPQRLVLVGEKKKVKQRFYEDAEVLRLTPVITEEDDEVKELILDALTITANLDDLTHYFLYQSYSKHFTDKEAVIVLMKAAIKRLNGNGQTQPLLTSQQKVNLTHFLLMYFSQHMSNNPKIKLACVDILWLNLTQLLRSTLESCLKNSVALKDSHSTLVLLTSQRSLYDYYAISHDIISDKTRYKPIEPHLLSEIEEIDNSSKALREALNKLFEDELMKTIVDITQSPTAVAVINQSSHLVKELQRMADLNLENVAKISSLLVELREPTHRWQSFSFFKYFRQILEKSINRFKKPLSYADALIVKPIQDMLDCCVQHFPQEPLQAVINKVENLQIEKTPSLRVPEQVNQLIARFKQCPQVFECELIGGAIRDLLLGLVPNDYDFVLKCKPTDFMAAFTDAYQPAPHKRPELFRLRSFEELGLPHDIVCVSDECPYIPDLTINTYRWNGFTLKDPNGALEDIEKNYLIVNGDSAVRFKNDPTMMLRIIRLSNSTGKSIQDKELKSLGECASLITSIEMGLYLANLAPLFLRSLDQAYRNINLLLRHNLLCCLLPVPFSDNGFLLDCCRNQNYLHYSVFELYMNHLTPQGVVFKQDTKYELLAIFLLPVLLSMNPNKQNKTHLIDQLVNDYCRYYKGFAKTDAGKYHTAYKVKASLSRKLARFVLPEPVYSAVQRLGK